VGGGSSSGGIPKGETIWLESGTKFPSSSSGQGSKYRRHGKYGLSSSSSGSGGYAKPKAEKGCFCSIGINRDPAGHRRGASGQCPGQETVVHRHHQPAHLLHLHDHSDNPKPGCTS
jgi:hypothetical protein